MTAPTKTWKWKRYPLLCQQYDMETSFDTKVDQLRLSLKHMDSSPILFNSIQ